jgi:hypothetical protein
LAPKAFWKSVQVKKKNPITWEAKKTNKKKRTRETHPT